MFAPVPGKPITVAYSWGPKVGPAGARNVMLQCPVSAIPEGVWDLLAIWWQSRLMQLPPVPGGFLDQPAIVQRAFPLFEQEFRTVEAQRGVSSSQTAAASAVAGVMAALGGGKKRR